jgi:glycosyltransferase involved in cell wall biosynthesis
MKIINIVNSFIGKRGNIGLRTSYIINELNKQNIDNFSYSRGVVDDYKNNNKNMGIFGHIPRILNAYRIYFNLWYNHRKHDILLFEQFFKFSFNDIESDKKIAHVWESSPKIIQTLKDKGYITILDVPIAPTATAQYLIDNFSDSIILHPLNHADILERRSYEVVNYIITPSVFVRDEIIKLGIDKNKIFTTSFGTELKDGYKKEFNKDYEKDGIDFCFAGTINRRKGIEFLLQAWNDEAFKNDRLHLCGRLYPEIKELLKEYDFKNVITPGFVDTKEYFKKCDVYVFPSLLEGSSKSIYEAMNMSIPCIVTPNSGSVIVDKEDGFIIDIASSDAIKEKMIIYKNKTELISIMGQKAYKNVQKYSWDIYANNILNIYKKVSC